jgi:hypothetical protein
MTPRSPLSSASLLLLGTEVPPRDLDLARLRKAYRKMAMLTHPDTRRRHNLPDFMHVRAAFEELSRYVAEAAPGSATRKAEKPAAGAASWYWKGQVPDRPLRLGEFLFYSGVIPWDALIKAVVEQKRARPNLGQLAFRVGLVTVEELAFALRRRNRGELLGDALVRLGFLDRATVDELVAEQKRLQRPLGWHLVRMGSIPTSDIPALLVKLWRHNAPSRRRG